MPPEAEESLAPRGRPIWSGALTFGLVSIPVNLYPGQRSARVALRMLDRDGTPLRRRYFCPKDGKELDNDEIVRGFPMDDDEYVVVTDEELEALEPRRSREIDLREFVELVRIDPVHFDRSYYLAPAGETTKAYRLLAGTMERTGRAGIATFVMRGKEYLVAILAEHGILRAETLRFSDELRTAEEIEVPDARAPAALVRRMEKVIRKHSASELDPAELEDRQSRRLLERIEAKRRRREDVVAVPAPAREAAREDEPIDLMEILKRNLRGARAGADARSDPDRMTVKALRERARELDVPGRSRMNRDELINAIRRAA